MLLRNLAVLMGHEVETSTATSLAGDISVESKTKGGA